MPDGGAETELLGMIYKAMEVVQADGGVKGSGCGMMLLGGGGG